MLIYVRQSFVTLLDFRPSNYGANLIYNGIDTMYERYALEVGSGDPGQPSHYDTFDYAEFSLGAAFRVRPADYSVRGTYQTETGTSSYQRYITVSVADNFVPSGLFDPARVPIPDASGWVDVVTDAMAAAATARGISDGIVGQISNAVELFNTLNTHMQQQLQLIENVLDENITPNEFDTATTQNATQLRADLLDQLDPALAGVIDALDLGFTIDDGWNLPTLVNRAWVEGFVEFFSQPPTSNRTVVLSSDAVDGYALNASRYLIHGGGGNDAFVHMGMPGNRYADPNDPSFSLADVSLLFGGAGYDVLTTVNATKIDLSTGWLWVGDGTVTPKIDAFLHGIESLVLGQTSETVVGSAAGNVVYAEGGDDTVNGMGGDDAIQGQAGADFLAGGAGNDALTGGLGSDRLLGEAGRDTLSGGPGRDFLAGGIDVDRLTGGTGPDRFVFNSLATCSDRITDFNAIDDTIVVSARAFGGGLVAGGVAAAQFCSRADNLAQDSDDRFVFRTTDQTLWFDANGSAAGGVRLIADLQAGAVFSEADILLV